MSHLLFGMLLWMAGVYAMERITSMDTAAYFVHLLKKGNFHFAHERSGVFLTQVLPALLSRWRAPAESVMLAYSLSLALVPYLAWLFVRYVAGSRPLAVALTLTMVVGVKYTWWWPVSEQFQAVVYTLAVWAWLRSPQAEFRPGRFLLLLAPLLLLALSTHPSSPLLVGFVFAFELAGAGRRRVRLLLLGAGLAWLLHTWWWAAYEPSAYDLRYRATFWDGVSRLPGSLNDYGVLQFREDLLSRQGTVLALLALGLPSLWWQRRRWQATTLLLAAIGWFLLASLANLHGNSPLMRENYLLPLSLMATGAATIALHGNWGRRWIWPVAIAVLLAGGLQRIRSHTEFMAQRARWHASIEAYMAQEAVGSHKLMLDMRNQPPETYFMVRWASGAESIARSAVMHPHAPRNYASLPPDLPHWEPDKVVEMGHFLWSSFWAARPLPDYPHRYLPWSLDKFAKAQVPDRRSATDLEQQFAEITAEVLPSAQPILAGKHGYLPVRFTNTGEQSLSSHLDNPIPVGINYFFGEEVVWRQIAMWADLPPGASLTQWLDVFPPTEAGIYPFRIVLAGPNGQIPVTVYRGELEVR